jgi:glycosyltransferase involved in cell wall biosynthesis
VIYELANRLAKREKVTVFCFNTTYSQENCNFTIELIRSPFANSPTKTMILAPFIYDKIGNFRSELKEFDVVNTHHYPANYIVRDLKGPLNLVTEWSGVLPSMFSSIKEKLYVKWTRHANKIAANKADLVLAPCEFVKDWILQNYSVDAHTIFLDGINFQIFDRFRVNSEKLFETYPAIRGKKIVLFVGRITESKNIHSLIEAFIILKQKIHDVVLLLVGDFANYGNYYARLDKLVSAKGIKDHVIFSGVVSWEDLPSYFAACTIYATCSLWEGFLRAESFAFGKPIVCFNVAANSETVSDGETGFLVEKNDTSKFAEKMCELLLNEDLARNMGENGYRWAKKNLDFETISNNFRSLCKDQLSVTD